jgi:hypothetical protein
MLGYVVRGLLWVAVLLFAISILTFMMFLHASRRPCRQGLGKVRACLVGDGRVSEGVGGARRVGREETGPWEGVQASKVELRLRASASL